MGAMNPSPLPDHSTSIPSSSAPRASRPWLVVLGAVLVGMALAAVLVRRSTGPPEDLDSIRSAVGARRFAEAEAGLLARLQRGDDDVAWVMLGGVRAMAGNETGAEAAYERIKGPGAAWTQAQTQLGEIALRRHDLARAEAVFRAVADSEPTALDARRRLAYLTTLTVRTDEAKAVLRELDSARPGGPPPDHLDRPGGSRIREPK